MGNRILITGAAGYAGSYLVKAAVDAGFQPVALDLAPFSQTPLISLDATLEYHQGSILETEILERSLDQVQAVIHLAGVSDGRAGKKDPELTRRVNLDAIDALLTLSKKAGVQRLLFASTMGVYGNSYREPFTETFDLRPVDPYSTSKAEAESRVRAAHDPAFATASLRIALLYGLGLGVRDDLLLNTLCLIASEEGVLKIQGGGQRRPLLHVTDLARAFIGLLQCPADMLDGTAFNVVESNPSVWELAELIKAVRPELELKRLPARDNEDSFEMNGDRFVQHFGFHPERHLEESIEELLNHYKTLATTI